MEEDEARDAKLARQGPVPPSECSVRCWGCEARLTLLVAAPLQVPRVVEVAKLASLPPMDLDQLRLLKTSIRGVLTMPIGSCILLKHMQYYALS